jgi:hypothetical protein
MPTPQRIKYFQPASRLAGVRYSVTSSTVDKVAAGNPPVLSLDAHVGAREQRGSQTDERRQRHQKHVKGIDKELLVPDR